MRLKYNNFLIIVPVFLFMGIILALFNFSLEKREMMWGLNSELKSTVLASSIFLKYNNINDDDKIRKAFTKIIKDNRVKEFVIIENFKTILHVQDNNFSKGDSYATRDIMLDKNISISSTYQSKGFFLIDASINIKDTNKTLVVTFDVTEFSNKYNNIYIGSLFIVTLITFIGILISILLSIVVSSKIESIGLMAQTLGSKKYDTVFDISKIKEFADLGITLDIMKSILQEAFLKTKNTMVQDRLMLKNDLALEIYAKQNNNQSYLKSSNISIVIEVAGDVKSSFHSIIEDEDYIYAYFGRVNRQITNEKYTIVTASILYYIDKVIKYENNINVDLISKYYNLESITISIINKKNAQIKVLTLNNDEKNIDLNNNKREIIFSSNERDNKFQKRTKSYLDSYSNISIKELSKDISLYKKRTIFMLIDNTKVTK